MSIATELLDLVEAVAALGRIPTVRDAAIPKPNITRDRDAEFGAISLGDGATGLFYAWMGESQAALAERFQGDILRERPVIDIARLLLADDDVSRSVGLAAVNAVTQHVFQRAGFHLPVAGNSMGGLVLKPGDRLGMIGNFPSLVRQARELDIPVIVIERKAHMLKREDGLEITDQGDRLSACNKIISTAAVMINNTVDAMVEHCQSAEEIVMIGPSASFFPDPLFTRGVSRIGGTQFRAYGAVDPHRDRVHGALNQSQRYLLDASDYPGFEVLLQRYKERQGESG